MQNAARLREQGWEGRILLLEGLFHENELALAEELSCDLVVHCEAQVEWLEKYQPHKPFNIFLKMNTGMNRLGFSPDQYRLAYPCTSKETNFTPFCIGLDQVDDLDAGK